jgi:MoxR-like ATPase
VQTVPLPQVAPRQNAAGFGPGTQGGPHVPHVPHFGSPQGAPQGVQPGAQPPGPMPGSNGYAGPHPA